MNMNLRKIYAYIHATNQRARRAFKNAWLEVAGILKEYQCIERQFINVYMLEKSHDTH